MSMNAIKNQIITLGREIAQAATRLAAMANDSAIAMADIEKAQANLADMNARMSALKASFAVQNDDATGVLVPLSDSEAQQERSLSDILKSKEYNRAFAYALSNGITRRTGRGNEKCSILYDALTESGGDPKGSDGGFLVPEDLDYMIRERRRELQPLADLFSVEYVTAPTGWRVVDTAPTKGFTKISGEMGQIASDDQPAFERVGYTTDTYALILPVSNELNEDSIENLYAYLSRWAAKKQVITENALLISALKQMSGEELNLATAGIKAIKSILNKSLDPAVSSLAKVLVNQDTFDDLDQLEDKNGRGLLQPDPTNAAINRMFGREIKNVSRVSLPGSDLFIGDFKEYATLFMRKNMEMAATDVGGSAWGTNSTEYRFITRMGATVFDPEAVVRRTLITT